MSLADDATKDRAASIEPPKLAPWRVASVQALPEYRLKVRFVDGLEGHVDMKKMVWSGKAGVFEALREPAVFLQAHVVLGVVSWAGDLDLAPDAMYDSIKAHGEWVVD